MRDMTKYIKLVFKGKKIKHNRKFSFPQNLNRKISKLSCRNAFRNMIEVYDLVNQYFHYNLVTLNDDLKEKTLFNLNREEMNVTVFYSTVRNKDTLEEEQIYIAMMELEPSLINSDILSSVVFKVENNEMTVIGQGQYIGINRSVVGTLEFNLFDQKHKVAHKITEDNEMTDNTMFDADHPNLEFGRVIAIDTNEINLILYYLEQNDLILAQAAVDEICEDLTTIDEFEEPKSINHCRLITLKDKLLDQNVYMLLSLYSLSTVAEKLEIRSQKQQTVNITVGHDQLELVDDVEQHQAKLYLLAENKDSILIGENEGFTTLSNDAIVPIYDGKIVFEYNNIKYCLEYSDNTLLLKGQSDDLALVNYFDIETSDEDVEYSDLYSRFETNSRLPVPFSLTENTILLGQDNEESRLLDTLYYNYYFDVEEQNPCDISLYRVNLLDEDLFPDSELFLALFRDVEDCKDANNLTFSGSTAENGITINVGYDDYVYCASRLIMKKNNQYSIVGRGSGDYGLSDHDCMAEGLGIIDTIECHYGLDSEGFTLGFSRHKNKSIVGALQYFGELEVLFDNPIPSNQRTRKNNE